MASQTICDWIKNLELTRIYFAPFHATTSHLSSAPCGSTIAAFKKNVKLLDWPYDSGDDPSFYAMRKFSGRLSWGICRQDVRNRLSPGDIVIFFSFHRFEETGDSEYQFCALATVERKVSQIDLWQDKKLGRFTKYFNLLIRPSKSIRGTWEHFEPTLEGSRLHADWVWRIVDHRGFRKEDFKQLQDAGVFKPGTTIRGHSLAVAANYVLFASDPAKTLVLAKPPVVAWHSKGRPAEEWNQDKFSQAVRSKTLDVAERANGRPRSLRIKNSQRAHRHIVFELPKREAESWRAGFIDLITTQSVA
jgi:hypothetical protein